MTTKRIKKKRAKREAEKERRFLSALRWEVLRIHWLVEKGRPRMEQLIGNYRKIFGVWDVNTPIDYSKLPPHMLTREMRSRFLLNWDEETYYGKDNG